MRLDTGLPSVRCFQHRTMWCAESLRLVLLALKAGCDVKAAGSERKGAVIGFYDTGHLVGLAISIVYFFSKWVSRYK